MEFPWLRESWHTWLGPLPRSLKAAIQVLVGLHSDQKLDWERHRFHLSPAVGRIHFPALYKLVPFFLRQWETLWPILATWLHCISPLRCCTVTQAPPRVVHSDICIHLPTPVLSMQTVAHSPVLPRQAIATLAYVLPIIRNHDYLSRTCLRI